MDSSAARNAWGAYSTIVSGFEGLGNFLISLMLLAAGTAMISHKEMPVGLGWVGFLAGTATLVRIFTTGTPLAGLAFAAFFPSLLLASLFDVWAGITILRRAASENWRAVEPMSANKID